MLNDLRYAFRTLRQNPGFALTAIGSIALAIGANSAIFSFQDGILFRPLPIERPSEVVTITSRPPSGFPEAFRYADFVELRDKNRSFEGLVAYRLVATAFTRDEAPGKSSPPEIKTGFMVSGNFFDLLGVKPALGRGFRPDEDEIPGREAVVVLAHEVWKNDFGADPSIVGSQIRLGPNGGLDFTVIGVAPEAFTGMDLFVHSEFFIPSMMGPKVTAVGSLLAPNSTVREFNVKGRLKPAVSIEAANSDIVALAKALESAFPEANRGRGALVRTEIQSRLDAAPIIGGVVAAVSGFMAVILVIACANVANLMLGRGLARAREIGVRLAIGAGRLRLLRQLMAESLVIAFIGGALGLFMASNAVAFFSTFDIATDISIDFKFQLDDRVLLFTIAVSMISAVLFGLVPSLQATKADLIMSLKAGESELIRKRFIGRNTLVTVQIAGSLVMLMTAAQMYRNTSRVLMENPGFAKDHRLLVRLDPQLTNYSAAQTVQFYRTLVERVSGTSGIRSAAITSGLPLTTEAVVLPVVPEGYDFPPKAASGRRSRRPSFVPGSPTRLRSEQPGRRVGFRATCAPVL